jgi:hypothetical protein
MKLKQSDNTVETERRFNRDWLPAVCAGTLERYRFVGDCGS